MQGQLERRIGDKSARVGVIGLGYVGLPLLNAFISAGFRTLGFDVDVRKVESLQAGKSYIKHIDSATVARWIDEKMFEPTADMDRMLHEIEAGYGSDDDA